MADKKESALGAVTDFAKARVLDASGASKNIDKATLASVLAGQFRCDFKTIRTSNENYQSDIQSYYSSLPNTTMFIAYINAGWHRIMFGYKSDMDFGCAVVMSYNNNGGLLKDYFNIDNGTWKWFL